MEKLSWLSILIVALCWGCDKPDAPDCFQKAGEWVEEERTFDNTIRTLEVYDRIDVRLVESDENRVVIFAPENLMPEVKTEIFGSRLMLDDDNTCDFVRDLSITPIITVYADLDSLINSGSGNIESVGTIDNQRFVIDQLHSSGNLNLTVNCDSLILQQATGNPLTTLKGHADYFYTYYTTFTPLNAANLLCEESFIHSGSINSASTFVTNKLVAVIESSGNIYYSGNPEEIVLVDDGDGELISQ